MCRVDGIHNHTRCRTRAAGVVKRAYAYTCTQFISILLYGCIVYSPSLESFSTHFRAPTMNFRLRFASNANKARLQTFFTNCCASPFGKDQHHYRHRYSFARIEFVCTHILTYDCCRRRRRRRQRSNFFFPLHSLQKGIRY